MMFLEIPKNLFERGWKYNNSIKVKGDTKITTYKKGLNLDKSIFHRNIIIGLCNTCVDIYKIFWNEFAGAGGSGYFPGPLYNKVLIKSDSKIILSEDMMKEKRPFEPIFNVDKGECSECKNIGPISNEFLTNNSCNKIKYEIFSSDLFFLNKDSLPVKFNASDTIKSIPFIIKNESINNINKRESIMGYFWNRGKLVFILNKDVNFESVLNLDIRKVENTLFYFCYLAKYGVLSNDKKDILIKNNLKPQDFKGPYFKKITNELYGFIEGGLTLIDSCIRVFEINLKDPPNFDYIALCNGKLKYILRCKINNIIRNIDEI